MKISPGQALLILLSNHKDNLKAYTELKKIYLLGITDDNRAAFTRYLNNEALKLFEISKDPEQINNDPSRRYFETHLSFATTEFFLKSISISELDAYINSIRELREEIHQNRDKHKQMGSDELNEKKFKEVLEVNSLKNIQDLRENKEYADFMYRLNNKEIFSNLSTEDLNKLKKIVAAVYKGFSLAQIVSYLKSDNSDDSRYDNILHLDIYASGLFSYGQRGKENKAFQNTSSTNAYGLIRPHAPLSQDDTAYTMRAFAYLKPSEQSSANANTRWVQQNYNLLVHPFSNSISGTLLCQLRVMQELIDKNKVSLDRKIFFRVLISAMLAYSGGHTLHEYTAVFDEARNLGSYKYSIARGIPGGLNLESLFWNDNQKALDVALEKNNQI